MKIMTIAFLGRMGQWGNQIFQYAFARTYARKHGLAYQVPPWVGQYFFGHVDPPVTQELPARAERYSKVPYEACFGVPQLPRGDEYAGHDFRGYAQYHTSYYAPEREVIQSLYTALIDPEAARMQPALEHLHQLGNTIISLHIRRADAGRMIYHLTPVSWYKQWLAENWQRFDKPVLFIATEDLALVPQFAEYRPVLVENLGITLRAELYPKDDIPAKQIDLNPPIPRRLDYFPDWWVLANSDVIVASDSTFSFSAAWVNRGLQEFWQSHLSQRGVVQLDPWDCPVSPREHIDEFSGVPGTQLDSNPYWESNYKPGTKAVSE